MCVCVCVCVCPAGSCLGHSECRGVVPAQPPPSTRADPCGPELTVLSLLGGGRRDSSGSAASSAYLSCSRRSSGISPCFSSRRSSQASQPELSAPRRRHNLSSSDSYDPISTDASRRSSEASQHGGGSGLGGGVAMPGLGWGVGGGGGGGGGAGGHGGSGSGSGAGGGGGGGPRGGGVLSLTPAQHYHLKAKYAAATGGPPPTPLPSMEPMGLRSRMALLGDAPDGGNPPLPPLVRPRRCSDGSPGSYGGYGGHNGYRHRALYPGEGMAGANRRASDPVRTVHVQEPSSLPTMHHRFSSLHNMQPLPPPLANQHEWDPRLLLGPHPHTRSEGNLQRSLASPCPPRIEEHAALEDLAMEEEDGGLLLAYEDLLPDDLVHYIHAQEPEACFRHAHSTNGDLHRPPNASGGGDVELLQVGAPEGAGRGSEEQPIQWNEVSSGNAHLSPTRPQQQQQQQQQQQSLQACGRWSERGVMGRSPFGRFGNMVVQQQQPQEPQLSADLIGQPRGGAEVPLANPSMGYRFPDCSAGSSRRTSVSRFPQIPACQLSAGVKSEASNTSCLESRRNSSTSMPVFRRAPDFSHIALGPIGQQQQQQQQPPAAQLIGNNLILQRSSQDALSHASLRPHPPASLQPISYRSSARPQPHLTNGHPASTAQLHPQPQVSRDGSLAQCALAGHISGLKIEAQDQGLSSCPEQQGAGGFFQPSFGACGQACGEAFGASEAKPLALPKPGGRCVMETRGGESDGPSALLLSPGADQVTSTVDGSPSCEVLDNVGLDFTPILEDNYDQGSLVSDVLSGSIFQGPSRASSRLTTPRASAAFASVPSGVNNMAIGDMSSLLSTLAQESRFLAIMQ